MQSNDAQKAFERAMRVLSMRAHSEGEIVQKLSRDGYDEHVIAEVMAKLYEYGLLDDAAFAAQWAQSRANRGMGPWRIAQELRQKGIDPQIADAAVSQLDEDTSADVAVELALKHLRRGDHNAKRRAYDAMVRRGFGYDMAREALTEAERLLQEELDEEDEEDPMH